MIGSQKKEVMKDRCRNIAKSIFEDLNTRMKDLLRGVDLEREVEKLKVYLTELQ